MGLTCTRTSDQGSDMSYDSALILSMYLLSFESLRTHKKVHIPDPQKIFSVVIYCNQEFLHMVDSVEILRPPDKRACIPKRRKMKQNMP